MINHKSDIFSIQTIETIQSDDFFNLIEKNRSHLALGFPYTILKCATPESTKDYLKESAKTIADKKGYFFYLRNKKTEALIGLVNIKNINKEIPLCELGYFIDREYQGKGITSMAVDAVLHFCFEELQMNKVFICTDKVNIGSQKVALKNGFLQEGILRNEFKNPKGELNDVVYFGLLRSDYYKNTTVKRNKEK
ncbi:GNAT family N-acetyltransferase [Flavobacteriaceae bacterium R38]|nr:GNAT family N-acetyltransferase [Flavobacteriaceae bacterium R38]